MTLTIYAPPKKLVKNLRQKPQGEKSVKVNKRLSPPLRGGNYKITLWQNHRELQFIKDVKFYFQLITIPSDYHYTP